MLTQFLLVLPSPELQVNSQSSQLWQKDLKVGVMGWSEG